MEEQVMEQVTETTMDVKGIAIKTGVAAVIVVGGVIATKKFIIPAIRKHRNKKNPGMVDETVHECEPEIKE